MVQTRRGGHDPQLHRRDADDRSRPRGPAGRQLGTSWRDQG
ncbi:hypothetical protein ACRAWD_02735 [Caulobacter segnis]